MTPTCAHVKDNGERCAVDFGLCSCHGACFHHAPCRAEERAKAKSKGGNATKAKNAAKHTTATLRAAPESDAPAAPETVEDAKDALSWLSWAAMTGKVAPAVARDSAAVLREFIKAVEKSDLEAEIAAMRAEMAEMRKGRGDR